MFQTSRLLIKQIVQRLYGKRLAAFDRYRCGQLEIRRAVTNVVCFGARSIFASGNRGLSGHVVATAGFRWRVDSMAACPGNRMHWDITTDYIASETDQLISESKAVYDVVGGLDSSAVTYDNVIKVLLHLIFVVLNIEVMSNDGLSTHLEHLKGE